jgi:hypothetical protein
VGNLPAAGASRRPGTATAPTVVAHFPLLVIVALVAGTVVLSVATTLVTLSLEHMRRARRTPAAATEPQAGVQPPQQRQDPKPGRARSSPATSTWPTTTCIGPTAVEDRHTPQQPLEIVILSSCRPASPPERSAQGQRASQIPASAAPRAEIGPIVMENPTTRVGELRSSWGAQPSRRLTSGKAASPPNRTAQFWASRLNAPAIDIQRIVGDPAV